MIDETYEHFEHCEKTFEEATSQNLMKINDLEYIERDIIDKQEEQLKSTPDLVAYEATASDNIAEITLTLSIECGISSLSCV